MTEQSQRTKRTITEEIEQTQALIRSYQLWSNKSFVDNQIEEERTKIRKIENNIATFRARHNEASEKLANYENRVSELQAELDSLTPPPLPKDERNFLRVIKKLIEAGVDPKTLPQFALAGLDKR